MILLNFRITYTPPHYIHIELHPHRTKDITHIHKDLGLFQPHSSNTQVTPNHSKATGNVTTQYTYTHSPANTVEKPETQNISINICKNRDFSYSLLY